MKEYRAKDAKEFLDLLRPSVHTWLSEGVLYSNWGFRGQANSSWRLLPSAWRPELQSYFQSGLNWARKNYAKPRLPARAQDGKKRDIQLFEVPAGTAHAEYTVQGQRGS